MIYENDAHNQASYIIIYKLTVTPKNYKSLQGYNMICIQYI